MRELPKIHQLKNLRAIIQYGGIRAASSAMHQTQPAMTRSIQELEKILGVSLLVRGVRGAVLTEMGRTFEPRMNLVLNELERALDELQQIKMASQGSVAFGCSHLLAFGVVPKVIKKFQQRNNTARITVFEGQLSELLASLRLGRLDFFIGVITQDILLHEFVEQHLATAQFCVFARKGHPLGNSTSLKELRGASWHIPIATAGYFSEMETLIFPYGKEAGCSVILGDSTTIAEQLILNEDYLSIGPKTMTMLPYLKDQIQIIPVKEKMPSGSYSLIYRQHQTLSPLAQQLVKDICACYLELMESE